MTSISKKGWLAVATETAPGTPAAAPTLYVPTKATYKNLKHRVYSQEDRGTRDGNYNASDTTKMAKGDFKGAWYNDSMGYFLMGFMGTDVVTLPTGATLTHSHALSLADVPPALTTWRNYDAAVFQFPYNVVDKMAFDMNVPNKVVDVDVSVQSYFGSKVTGAFTPVFSAVVPMAAWNSTISISGTTSTIIEEMKITLEQKVTPYFSSGSQGPTAFDYGERQAKIEFTARFADMTQYSKFLSTPPTDDSFIVTFTGGNIETTFVQELIFNFPIIGYDEVDVDTSKDVVLLKAKATARPGTTANSLFTATIQNGVTSYAA